MRREQDVASVLSNEWEELSLASQPVMVSAEDAMSVMADDWEQVEHAESASQYTHVSKPQSVISETTSHGLDVLQAQLPEGWKDVRYEARSQSSSEPSHVSITHSQASAKPAVLVEPTVIGGMDDVTLRALEALNTFAPAIESEVSDVTSVLTDATVRPVSAAEKTTEETIAELNSRRLASANKGNKVKSTPVLLMLLLLAVNFLRMQFETAPALQTIKDEAPSLPLTTIDPYIDMSLVPVSMAEVEPIAAPAVEIRLVEETDLDAPAPREIPQDLAVEKFAAKDLAVSALPLALAFGTQSSGATLLMTALALALHQMQRQTAENDMITAPIVFPDEPKEEELASEFPAVVQAPVELPVDKLERRLQTGFMGWAFKSGGFSDRQRAAFNNEIGKHCGDANTASDQQLFNALSEVIKQTSSVNSFRRV